MTYKEAREFIDASNQYGSKLGLEAVTGLLNRLDNPQDRLRVIHVAGTNGKGSTAAFISSILASEGYLVGRYISPAVFSYRERIQVNRGTGEAITSDYITEEGVAKAIEQVKPVCESMAAEGIAHPTSFEIETAMAFLYLERMQVDFAVIEVGLGGRLDATNAVKKPEVSVITSISMDHMQYLGSTLAQIAFQKAGIIKKGVPVVTCNHNPEILDVIREEAEKLDAGLFVTSQDITDIRFTIEGTGFNYGKQHYKIELLGEYQVMNAVLAVETAEVLRGRGCSISSSSIKNGLLRAKWSGRFEIISRKPYFIIDGAHNEDAAVLLRNSLQQYFPGRSFIFIMGVLADKEYKKILNLLAPLASVLITVTPDNSRALVSSRLASEAGRYTEAEIIDAADIPGALKTAYERASIEDVIVAFGSLSYLGELVQCFTHK